MYKAIEDMGQLPGTQAHLYRGHSFNTVLYNLHGGSGGYYSLKTCLEMGGLNASAVAHLLHCFDPATRADLSR